MSPSLFRSSFCTEIVEAETTFEMLCRFELANNHETPGKPVKELQFAMEAEVEQINFIAQ